MSEASTAVSFLLKPVTRAVDGALSGRAPSAPQPEPENTGSAGRLTPSDSSGRIEKVSSSDEINEGFSNVMRDLQDEDVATDDAVETAVSAPGDVTGEAGSDAGAGAARLLPDIATNLLPPQAGLPGGNQSPPAVAAQAGLLPPAGAVPIPVTGLPVGNLARTAQAERTGAVADKVPGAGEGVTNLQTSLQALNSPSARISAQTLMTTADPAGPNARSVMNLFAEGGAAVGGDIGKAAVAAEALATRGAETALSAADRLAPATTGGLQLAGPSSSPGSDHGRQSLLIPETVRQPGWDAALGSRVAWMARENLQLAEIRLTPPSLGTLEVRISVHDKDASIQFSTPHGMTREALQDALPRLRDMLANEGLTLGDVNVSDQSLGQQQEAMEGGAESSSLTSAEDEPAAGELLAAADRRVTLGLLDEFA